MIQGVKQGLRLLCIRRGYTDFIFFFAKTVKPFICNRRAHVNLRRWIEEPVAFISFYVNLSTADISHCAFRDIETYKRPGVSFAKCLLYLRSKFFHLFVREYFFPF